MSSSWRAGENPQDFEQSKQRCQLLADEQYPPSRDEQERPTSLSGLDTSHCTFQKANNICMPRHVSKTTPPHRNQINRSTYFHQCMAEKGWIQEGWTAL
ncbi:hypothetical protein BFG52_08570 [Acinetobacter larvae]|uniref:Uncharacterized protein n=2 Tax=Acinetobacter larvae TaxID=1789224 RepID=A0A1B2LZR7_9GAMM|nr:hypothetical protein BFG52_08570 [Acinetobacter larvae]